MRTLLRLACLPLLLLASCCGDICRQCCTPPDPCEPCPRPCVAPAPPPAVQQQPPVR